MAVLGLIRKKCGGVIQTERYISLRGTLAVYCTMMLICEQPNREDALHTGETWVIGSCDCEANEWKTNMLLSIFNY